MIRYLVVVSSLLVLFPSITYPSLPERWEYQNSIDRMYKREILTYTSIEPEGTQQHFEMEGAGIAKVPPSQAWVALWAERCWVKHIHSVHKIDVLEEDPTTKVLYIEASVLRIYWIRSRIKINLNKEENKMNWEFIQGDMLGMHGSVELLPFGKGTIVNFRNDLVRNKFNIPSFVVKFALSFAIKQAGWSLRGVMEEGNKDRCLTS